MKTTFTTFISESRQADEGLNKIMQHIIDNPDQIENVSKRYTIIYQKPVLDFTFDKDEYSFYLEWNSVSFEGSSSIYNLPEDINDKLREILVGIYDKHLQTKNLEKSDNEQSQIMKRLKRFGL